MQHRTYRQKCLPRVALIADIADAHILNTGPGGDHHNPQILRYTADGSWHSFVAALLCDWDHIITVALLLCLLLNSGLDFTASIAMTRAGSPAYC